MRPAFYFDVGSPYVYLTAGRLALDDVDWKPISLGGLFKLTGRSSWGLSERRAEGMAEIEARALRYGLPPMRWPEPWPGHYLGAMRACLVAAEQDLLEPFARTALRMGFVEGRDLSALDNVLEGAERVGVEGVRERMVAPEIKQRLIDATAAARERGVFGVPTLVDGEAVVWGDDRIRPAAPADVNGGH